MSKKGEVDAIKSIEKLDYDILSLVNQSETNLKQIAQIDSNLEKRVKQIDLMESKYQQLMERVDSVLGLLETKLKQL